MGINLQTIESYYANALPLQFRGLPKASATAKLLAKEATGDFMAEDLRDAFDLATAVGPQLDILAKYIGASRDVQTTLGNAYFGFADYGSGGSTNGFQDYGLETPPSTYWNPDALFYSYDSVNSSMTHLSDSMFSFCLQLQAALNQFDGTLAWIQKYLQKFFPGRQVQSGLSSYTVGQVTVVDGLNMTLTYKVPHQTPIDPAILANFLPHPMGVTTVINIV